MSANGAKDRIKIPYVFPILAGANNTPILFQYLQGWPSPASNTFHTFRGGVPSNPRKTLENITKPLKITEIRQKSLEIAKKTFETASKRLAFRFFSPYFTCVADFCGTQRLQVTVGRKCGGRRPVGRRCALVGRCQRSRAGCVGWCAAQLGMLWAWVRVCTVWR